MKEVKVSEPMDEIVWVKDVETKDVFRVKRKVYEVNKDAYTLTLAPIVDALSTKEEEDSKCGEVCEDAV